MAIFMNGVMVSRDTGVLMPSPLIDEVKISDCTINALKLDSGNKKITKTNGGTTSEPIQFTPANLPIIHNGAWSLETEFYANFNGDLEAGPISFYGKEIDGIAVRRSSNRTNFCVWEDVRIINNVKDVVNESLEYKFKDKAIESGLWYLYAIQPISKDERGSLYKTPKKALIYESAYLVGENGRQLELRYDTAISAFRTNVRETRIETLGSRYPFIARNGNVEYKEFSLTGLVTHFMDDSSDFAPKANLFVEDEFANDTLDITEDYNSLYRQYDINDNNNTTLEREFKSKVLEFLNDGKPKLFKSPKDGFILVRLMDVSLSPRPDINGGMVCNFACNAIEIDAPTIENLNKFNIQRR